MFHFCKNIQILKILTVTSLLVVTASVFANKAENHVTNVLSAMPSNVVNTSAKNSMKSSPNSSVVLDFSIATGESWDAKDSSNNVIANCVNGDSITGFEYTNVTIKTVGGSFFSEAVIYFSDSSNGNNGLRLTAGAGDNSSGTKTFSSNEILDLTDNGLDDIVSSNDGVFLLQFYENIDDQENAIDARYINGIISIWGVDLVPSDNCPFIMSGGQTNPDLSVSYTTDQQNNYSLNESIEFTILINNIGDGIASNVNLNNTLSDKLDFNHMTCNDGTSTTNINSLSSFNVQNISNNSSLTCTIEASIIAYGFIENSVSVSADNDSNLNNNNATVMASGAHRIVPVNNYFALLLLVMAFGFIARKRIS